MASASIARRIVEEAGLAPDDAVLEIGPGRGALTQHYAGRVAQTLAIEIDPRFVDYLQSTWGDCLRVFPLDVREVQWSRLAFERPPVVLGNLPYKISKPVIKSLLDWGGYKRAIIMIQKELAERLLAAPGQSAYSLFSVYFSLRAKGEKLFDVEPQAFKPPPQVMSSVLRLVPRPLAPEPPELARVLRASFFSRRQKLLNNLRREWKTWEPGRIVAAIEKARISPAARAQEVSVEQFLELARNLI